MPTQPNLINVKLGDITGNYSSYYNDLNICDFTKQINKDENAINGIFLLYFVLGVLLLVIYPFFGFLATIFFHNKLYGFLHNYVQKMNSYPFSPSPNNISILRIDTFSIYKKWRHLNEFLLLRKLKPKNFLGILDLILITLILSLTTWVVLILFIYRFIQKYNWYGLYHSLTKKGYQPQNFDSWITVSEKVCINCHEGLKYVCKDGNHRHIILLLIHGPEKEVKVRLV